MSTSKETTPGCVSSSEAKPLTHPPSVSPNKSESASTPAAKKRKLSPASQVAKQQEKEAREQQKLEEKAKKEEEKRIKAEEKKKRDEEREEEKRLKEEEKKKREAEREEKKKAKDGEKAAKEAAKEEEKRRKEEEKLKKDRVCPVEGLGISFGISSLTCYSRLNPNSTLFSRNRHYLPSLPDLHQATSPLRKSQRLATRSFPSQIHLSRPNPTTKGRSQNSFSNLTLNSHPPIDLSVIPRLLATSAKSLMPL
jgi:flagellar biosynthesis GTPase FlhF